MHRHTSSAAAASYTAPLGETYPMCRSGLVRRNSNRSDPSSATDPAPARPHPTRAAPPRSNAVGPNAAAGCPFSRKVEVQVESECKT